MRFLILLPASLLAAALALPSASPAGASVLVTIDKNAQRMSVSVDGEMRYNWPVSTGRPGFDTPNGTFRPFRMEADHFSKEWDDAPMPHSIFFTKIGHAIHGSLDVRHLGSAASHGCVRLSPDHASSLYALVQAEGLGDTTVVIAGQTPAGASPEVARRRAPTEEQGGDAPMQIAPAYPPQPAQYYVQQQPYYGQPQVYYRQPQPYYVQQQPYYGQPQQPYYGQPVYQQPQPFFRPYNPQ